MAFAVENIRLKELAVVADLNRPIFDYFIHFLKGNGYANLHSFVTDNDEGKTLALITKFLTDPMPRGICLFDGIARPYLENKAKWLLLGWILRDAPEQRLRPMIASMSGNSIVSRQAELLNKVRAFVGEIFPQKEKWEWNAISEVFIDRLEGSRRSIKGTLFEAIVRRLLRTQFESIKLPLEIRDVELRLGGETYDVSVTGKNGQVLVPVKTRETMGGGHAGIFTRDIHKSIAVARRAGFECLPIIIAESWFADLKALDCDDFIYIDRNPNQIKEVEPMLDAELGKRLEFFKRIM